MSNIPDDGDPVRALGFLTLYSGNLEAAMKEELERIQRANIVKLNPAIRTLGSKIGELEKFQAHYASNHPSGANCDERQIIDNLIAALRDFTRNDRNPLVHGSIIGTAGSDKLVLTDNATGERRPITSAEIYDAANFASELYGGVIGLRYILKRHLTARKIACDFDGNRI